MSKANKGIYSCERNTCINISHKLITARKRSLGQGNIFTPVCHSVQSGGVLQGGVLPGGAWSRGVPGPGGGCLLPGVPGGDPPGYCCGRYASYWNAFLLKIGLFGSKSVNSLKTNTTCIPCENKSLLLLLLNFLKNKILSAVTIAQGGVLPNIQTVLLPKKSNKAK